MIPVLAQRRVTPADVELAKQLLEQVGLGARARHRPGELSAGKDNAWPCTGLGLSASHVAGR
jgi:NitT/TauT family transport system ATP-binding protein